MVRDFWSSYDAADCPDFSITSYCVCSLDLPDCSCRGRYDHKIIWGDAKADNFMVDAHNELWIIDFGGSYTEGWIDPELAETEQGDITGVKKIVNALYDPVGMTVDDENEPNKASEKSHKRNHKRKHMSDHSDNDDEKVSNKKHKKEKRRG